jgi:hypothetical protein
MVFISGCKQTLQPTQRLKINLRLDKHKYQMTDDIHGMIKIKNTGAPIKINIRFAPQCLDPHIEDWEISFLIFDSKGKQYNPARCLFVDYAMPWYQQLEKGNVYEYDYKLSYKNFRKFYSLDKPGKYTIQAIYHNVYGSTAVWKGEIKSNIVTFTINP